MAGGGTSRRGDDVDEAKSARPGTAVRPHDYILSEPQRGPSLTSLLGPARPVARTAVGVGPALAAGR